MFDAFGLERRPDVHSDCAATRRWRGLGAQFWAAWVPCFYHGDPAVRETLEQIELIWRFTEHHTKNRFARAVTSTDLRSAHESGRIASLIGVEGGHSIDASLDVLRAYARLGARYLTLTHNKNTAWADSATDTRRHGGLNDFGRRVVEELDDLGLVPDLSHVSVEVVRDTLEVTRAPTLFTHSCAHALCPHPRNVPDEWLLALADQGGVCCVTFVPSFLRDEVRRHWVTRREIEASEDDADRREAMLTEFDAQNPVPQARLEDVADHIEHVRKIAGIDHVGIGGDFDGIESVPVGLEDSASYPRLFAELFERGWSDEDCAKLAGGNVLRVLEAREDAARRPLGWRR